MAMRLPNHLRSITKTKFKRRMQEIGLWAEAVDFREKEKRRLRVGNPGLTDQTIANKAYFATAARFKAAFMGVNENDVPPPPMDHGSEIDGSPSQDVTKSTTGPMNRPSPTPGSKEEFHLRLAEVDLSDKKTTIRTDVEFVYQNIEKEYPDIDVKEVPCRGAVALLAQARLDPPWFFTTYHAKLLGNRAQLDADDGKSAGKGRQDEMIENVIDALPKMVEV